MKNFQQNLLIFLALALCALCVWQWHGQTLQRRQTQSLSQLLYDKSVAIQGYTNSIKAMDHQIAELEARISELKESFKSNDQAQLAQKNEIKQLTLDNAALTNQVSAYKLSVAKLEATLKEADDGIVKQNAAIKEIVNQRDEFVHKYNDSVKDRNDIVTKYNDLVKQMEKLQSGGKAGDK